MFAGFYVVTRTGVVLTKKWRTKTTTAIWDGKFIIIIRFIATFVGRLPQFLPVLNYASLDNDVYALTPAFFNEVLAGRSVFKFKELNDMRSWCTEFRDNYYNAMMLPLPEELCRVVYDHLSNASRSIDDWCAQSDCDLRCE